MSLNYPRKTIDRIRLILLFRDNIWRLVETKDLFEKLKDEQHITRIVEDPTMVNPA